MALQWTQHALNRLTRSAGGRQSLLSKVWLRVHDNSDYSSLCPEKMLLYLDRFSNFMAHPTRFDERNSLRVRKETEVICREPQKLGANNRKMGPKKLGERSPQKVAS
jgi:hypothetical protein